MKAAAFEYHAPRSVSAATDLLARYADEDARILAGGQSLVPAMALRVAAPAHLIDINGIDELGGLDVRRRRTSRQSTRASVMPRSSGRSSLAPWGIC